MYILGRWVSRGLTECRLKYEACQIGNSHSNRRITALHTIAKWCRPLSNSQLTHSYYIINFHEYFTKFVKYLSRTTLPPCVRDFWIAWCTLQAPLSDHTRSQSHTRYISHKKPIKKYHSPPLIHLSSQSPCYRSATSFARIKTTTWMADFHLQFMSARYATCVYILLLSLDDWRTCMAGKQFLDGDHWVSERAFSLHRMTNPRGNPWQLSIQIWLLHDLGCILQ